MTWANCPMSKQAELRDKKCPSCPRFIMRKSSHCRSCSQSGDKSIHWKNAKPICPNCKVQKDGYNKGLCRNCFRGKNHFAFKKDVGYTALHDWVRRYLGRATYCSNNNSHISRRFVWANVSGLYRRDFSDWRSLCNSCNLTDGIKIAQRFTGGISLNV